MKAFAVRWTGTLTPPGPGDYTFSVPNAAIATRAGDQRHIVVYLDGKLVTEGCRPQNHWQPDEAPPIHGTLRGHPRRTTSACGIYAQRADFRRRRHAELAAAG